MMIPRSWAFNFVAFVAFEYLITFDQEVNLFWKRKITGATILFFFNRYIVLLLYVMNISGSGSLSKSVQVSLPACGTFPIASSLTVIHLQGCVSDSNPPPQRDQILCHQLRAVWTSDFCAGRDPVLSLGRYASTYRTLMHAR